MKYYSSNRVKRYIAGENPVCSKCGAAERDASNLTKNVFLTSRICGHRYCPTCKGRHFSAHTPVVCQGPYGKGIGCGKPLVYSDLVAHDFNDIIDERDRANRSRVMAVFNKFEGDFERKELYDAYIEEAESLIYNLSNGIRRDEAERRLKEVEVRDSMSIVARKRQRDGLNQEKKKRFRQEVQERERRRKRVQEEAEERRLADLEHQKQKAELSMGKRTTIDVLSGKELAEKQRRQREREAQGLDVSAADGAGAGGVVPETSMAMMWLNPQSKPDIRNATKEEMRQHLRRAEAMPRERLAEMRNLAAGYKPQTITQVRRLEAMTGLAPLMGRRKARRVAKMLAAGGAPRR